VDDESAVVRRLEARHTARLSGLELPGPLDGHEHARNEGRGDPQRVLDSADDVLRLDRDSLERRRITKSRLEPEGEREAVAGDLWQRDGEIGPEHGAAVLGRAAAVAHERAQQTAAVELGHRGRELDLRRVDGRQPR
jgi:hypothetical protein